MGNHGEKHVKTAAHAKKVKEMAEVGIPQDDIAFYLDISKNTLRKYYARELKLGSIEASIKVGGNLFRMTATHPAAAIFWKKTRDGWKEKEPDNLNNNTGDVILQRGNTRKSATQPEETEKKNGTDDTSS